MSEPTTHFDGFTITQGQLVSDRVMRIVTAIREYSHELDVEWIPDRQAREQDRAQFKIVHRPLGKPEFTLFYVKNEEEFDERVLQRIIVNDQGATGNKVTLNEYEAWEHAKKLIENQVWQDALDEIQELSASIVKSSKDTYKVNKDLVIKENIPGNQAPRTQVIDTGKVSPNSRNLPNPFKRG